MLIFLLLYTALSKCDVYVMAPLDVLDNNQNPNNFDYFKSQLDKLKEANVDGIMLDVWWGLVEQTENVYKWDGYTTLFNCIKEKGMKIIPVLSFHQCGGNVGDTCDIKLPNWIFSQSKNPAFVSSTGETDQEYISFSYDQVQLGKRTPLEMYRDFMSHFKSQFQSFIDSNWITTIEVGLGPCGELRYPSYPLSHWDYPQCGDFQSYDEMSKKLFIQDAKVNGHQEWKAPPTDTGGYRSLPGESEFWKSGYKSDYGKYFQEWYANQLVDHGSNVLRIAREIFPNIQLSAKISGIHWQYMTDCRCAEATAGFYQANGADTYSNIIQMLKKHNVVVCFTCLEMTGIDEEAQSHPENLVKDILEISKKYNVKFEGENALEKYDNDSYNKILEWAEQGLSAFTYLRLTSTLTDDSDNYNRFKEFVDNMHK